MKYFLEGTGPIDSLGGDVLDSGAIGTIKHQWKDLRVYKILFHKRISFWNDVWKIIFSDLISVEIVLVLFHLRSVCGS